MGIMPLSGAVAAETPQSLVSQGTALANQEKYEQAIPLYEKALSQLSASDPNRKTLSRNVGVLYSNAAVVATNAKQYEHALQLAEKALTYLPNDTQIKRTKASVFFNQAMDLREAGQENPDVQNFEKIENLLRNAMQWDPNEPNFKRALAANYNDNALALAAQSHYEEAIKLLEAAQKLVPTDPNFQISLKNIRQMAQQETAGNTSETTTSPLPEGGGPPEGGVRAASSEATEDKPHLPASARKLSMSDMLLDVENQLGIARDTKLSLKDRVENAEKQLLGNVGDGALSPRVEKLYANVFGAAAASQPDFVQAPVETSQFSYLNEVFKVTDGKVIRWGKFPLRVYVEDPTSKDDQSEYKGKNLTFKPEYKDAVFKGLEVWKQATEKAGKNQSSFITFVPVKSDTQADVVFKWDHAYVDLFADPDKVPSHYQNFSPPKTSKLARGLQIASMFTPGIFSLAPQALAAGVQYKQLQKLEAIKQESEVTLGLDPVKDLPEDQALLLIQNMAAKEFGHILGLKCASPEPGDLLYPELKSDTVQTPSRRDLETLRQLYGRPANIVLNVTF